MIETLLSIVCVVRNAEDRVLAELGDLRAAVLPLVSDCEIIVVDNASIDGTVARLEDATAQWTDIQVYCCAAPVNQDTARLAGLEQAIGDYVLMFDPARDSAAQIGAMLELAVRDKELVLARNRQMPRQSGWLYRLLSRGFIRLFRFMAGIDLRQDAPHFRLMSRRLVNYVLQHENAYLTYQMLPVLAGFKVDRLIYDAPLLPCALPRRSLREIYNQSVSLVVASTTLPMRLVSLACAAASVLSLLYSLYVVLVYLFKSDVAPGWTTLSLQFSVQFFLIAMALALLSEYVLQISRQTNRRPKYYIVREFRSSQMTRELKLNLQRERP